MSVNLIIRPVSKGHPTIPEEFGLHKDTDTQTVCHKMEFKSTVTSTEVQGHQVM